MAVPAVTVALAALAVMAAVTVALVALAVMAAVTVALAVTAVIAEETVVADAGVMGAVADNNQTPPG
jgi:hypothetical protein